MAKQVTIETAIVGTNSITPNFSIHERGVLISPDDVGGNFIIDVDGLIFMGSGKSSDITITVIGGIDAHIGRKDNKPPGEYFTTYPQKRTIFNLAYRFGQFNKYNGMINQGNNEGLYHDFLGAFEAGRR